MANNLLVFCEIDQVQHKMKLLEKYISGLQRESRIFERLIKSIFFE